MMFSLTCMHGALLKWEKVTQHWFPQGLNVMVLKFHTHTHTRTHCPLHIIHEREIKKAKISSWNLLLEDVTSQYQTRSNWLECMKDYYLKSFKVTVTNHGVSHHKLHQHCVPKPLVRTTTLAKVPWCWRLHRQKKRRNNSLWTHPIHLIKSSFSIVIITTTRLHQCRPS